MPRTPFGRCNLVTGNESTAYRPSNRPVAPQITIPTLRARLDIDEAAQLVADLTDAIAAAKANHE